MGRGSATPDAWHPETQQDREAILRELQKILDSAHFCNSKRYPALLSFIVENTLAGKSDLLKERTLGVEVFDRPATYDTNADTVVRYTAGEVRKRLLLYYHEDGKDSNIRIHLPAGSYIPEFLHGHDGTDVNGDRAGFEARHLPSVNGFEDRGGGAAESALIPHPELSDPGILLPRPTESAANLSPTGRKHVTRILSWLAVAVVVVLAAAAGFIWQYRIRHPETIVDDFWAPVLHGQQTAIICAGSSLFVQDLYSGEITTGTNRNAQYPFVSMQTAAAIAQIEQTMEDSGVKAELLASPWSTLADLREHSVTLLGAYNNQWTPRLTEPLRYHFRPNPRTAIIDSIEPEKVWERDQMVPYSSADDYALVARFRDPTIDGWVMVLAGLGRNGTEAATQFATSPHYLQLLKGRMGSGFGNRNIEVVLKVSVIAAKTGAPSIVAVYTW
jgi:hypothetical protein